jgi:hypothetical protein
MKTSTMTFDGSLLNRGFWIYVIRITGAKGRRLMYVGRTGDNSSRNAGSPFRRIAAHLNLSPSARGNSLSRLLLTHELNAETCQFRLIAVGPIFRERSSMRRHRPIRNRMTAIEKAVADHFRKKGFEVLGKHDDNEAKSPKRTARIISALERAMRR